MKEQFEKFTKSDFGLEIRSDERMIFHSKKSGIQGLLEFIGKEGKSAKDLIVFDTKVGNAAALLCAYIKVREVYGVVGSQSAAETLRENNIKLHFLKTIPNILNKDKTDICPMEKMSFRKIPEEFLDLLKKDTL